LEKGTVDCRGRLARTALLKRLHHHLPRRYSWPVTLFWRIVRDPCLQPVWPLIPISSPPVPEISRPYQTKTPKLYSGEICGPGDHVAPLSASRQGADLAKNTFTSPRSFGCDSATLRDALMPNRYSPPSLRQEPNRSREVRLDLGGNGSPDRGQQCCPAETGRAGHSPKIGQRT